MYAKQASDGYAVIHGDGFRYAVPLAAAAVRLLSRILSGLPRGFEDVAPSPADFEVELDIERVHDPARRRLMHRLRRAWVMESRRARA